MKLSKREKEDAVFRKQMQKIRKLDKILAYKEQEQKDFERASQVSELLELSMS